ncbi:hypothetical protein [Mycobacterium sp. ACS4331]|uniref:hypothetical protein n=1 Tax=Mycobacterium sp. ACS4331 TaxID=1834121 RepID=UPI0007FDA209|nr:hypothetical protein [Mycobacterium sp. ACS4331]OBF11266.1 hypothetical protein A5727_20170 [Mycobacterium sp. ACS4331]
MSTGIGFSVRGHTPTLAHYRRDWAPQSAAQLSGVWIGAVVSDEDDQQYWGVRGTDDFIAGMTHVVSPVCGFRSLPTGFNPFPPHLFPEYAGIDWFEPMTYQAGDDRIQTGWPSGRIERDADGFHWYDASGRWEIHGTPISDAVITHVPRQTGVDHEVFYRHELMHARGSINGVEVSGYAHQDFAYGPDGMIYTELPIARHLQGMWVSWLHEYDDGEVGGGSFWQGRDGLDFGPGYLVKNGLTTTFEDITAETGLQDGHLVSLTASLGDEDYSFTFDTMGSPLHYFGRLDRGSSGQRVARSWCWVEYANGMLTPEILDAVSGQYALARGKA